LTPGCPNPPLEELPFIRYCWGICPVGQNSG
jgi:hypothetical protein